MVKLEPEEEKFKEKLQKLEEAVGRYYGQIDTNTVEFDDEIKIKPNNEINTELDLYRHLCLNNLQNVNFFLNLSRIFNLIF